MDIIYKVLITILSVIILLSTGFSITLSIADEIETNHYLASVTETLIDSHYSEQVKEQLIEEASEKGYLLNIELYGSTKPGAYKYAIITLSYEFHLDMFDITLPREKQKII
ncbi:MAG: hypothetical protein IJ958_03210 [Agathobacter sp.]|nr:hypothetical protein [Agathobacter sp.]